MKHSSLLLASLAIVAVCGCKNPAVKTPQMPDKYVVAYVCSWTPEMPDGRDLTHINYAFGSVNKTFDGVDVGNPDRLRSIVALKEQYPLLKVELSIGGWTSGRFSEMAADSLCRTKFAADCKRIVDEFGLDGIDMDWEYPTSSAAGISSSPDDTENYTLLMRDIRAAIGPDKLLTQATVCSALYMDFAALDPYIDFTNIMAYDMGRPPYHNAALYRSPHAGYMTAAEAVEAHLAAGIRPDKLTLGMPFYGHGVAGFPAIPDLDKADELEGYECHWDTLACVPWMSAKGDTTLLFSYDNSRSLALKCEYLLSKGLKGAMYWSYDGDNAAGDLKHTLFTTLNK